MSFEMNTVTFDDALAILRRSQPELVRWGVRRAAVFGSVARNEATDTSDVDVLLNLEQSTDFGVYEFVALTRFLGEQFPVPVDVVNRATLKPHVCPFAEWDTLYAF